MGRMRCIVELLVLVTVFAVPAWADLTIDFESPTYGAGNLEGQDSWARVSSQDASCVQVVGGSVVNGLQSVKLISPLYMGRPIAGQTLQDGSTVSVTMKADSSDLEGNALFGLRNTDGLWYALIWANADGYFYVLNSTRDGWITTGRYYYLGDKFTITITLDFTNGKWKAKVINMTNPALGFLTGWNSFSAPTSPASGAGSVVVGGKTLWLDDIVLKETNPAPQYDLDTKIDFEAPKYAAGILAEQDGWETNNFGAALVNTDAPLAGLRSGFLDSLCSVWRPLNGQAFQDGTTLRAKIKVDYADGLATFAQLMLKDAEDKILAASWFNEDSHIYTLGVGATSWSDTGWSYQHGDELHITIRFYFAAQMWQLSVDNISHPDKSGTAWYRFVFPETPTSAKGSLLIAGVKARFDDLQITQEPLPFPDPITLQEAKSAPEDTVVNVTGYVSALYDGWFNIEDGDRTVGFVVAASGEGLSLGQEVRLVGVVKTNPALGERGIYTPMILPLSGSKIIEPLEMTNKALGGGPGGLQKGVVNASGLNNVGLLVKTTGRVSVGLGGEYFALDDGSGVTVVAWYGGAHPAIGSYIAATGTVSTLEDGNENLQRQLILTGFQPIVE